MHQTKKFNVLGATVEVLLSGEQTGGLSAMLIENSPPGGGPPPHSHKNEDELFYPLEGDYEIFDGKDWHKVEVGSAANYRRGGIHTFRNAGKTSGRLLIVVTPAGMEKYLEEISPLSLPQDMEKLVAISARYGITFHL
jgi:quercetin dioxygenase-like cupin family protein